MRTRIVVDERERASGIPDLLRNAGAAIDFAQLVVGDYIVSPEVAVERKSVHDLISSIYDGRLYVQCSELVKNYSRPVVIIQGDIAVLKQIPEDAEESKARRMAERTGLALDALATVAMEFRIPVLHAPDVEQTAMLLLAMANKGLQNKASGPLLKKIKKENPFYVQQLSILSSVPGVGEKLAARMLERFKTPQRALMATAAELATIPGFGLARARRVRKVIDTMASQDLIAQRTLFDGQ